jgi:hypothetical protein
VVREGAGGGGRNDPNIAHMNKIKIKKKNKQKNQMWKTEESGLPEADKTVTL